jgi:hypothetical protein
VFESVMEADQTHPCRSLLGGESKVDLPVMVLGLMVRDGEDEPADGFPAAAERREIATRRWSLSRQMGVGIDRRGLEPRTRL